MGSGDNGELHQRRAGARVSKGAVMGKQDGEDAKRVRVKLLLELIRLER